MKIVNCQVTLIQKLFVRTVHDDNIVANKDPS